MLLKKINKKKLTINDKVDFINLLLYKWALLSQLAATSLLKHTGEDTEENILIPLITQCAYYRPVEAISAIKDTIIDMVEGSDFIKPDFEYDPDLLQIDFIELYCSHQQLSIERIIDLVNKGIHRGIEDKAS
jgi:hypothetical protein